MRRYFRIIYVGVWGIALAGCSAGNFNSIHRYFDLRRGYSQLVDVKQRSILVSNQSSEKDTTTTWVRDPDPNKPPTRTVQHEITRSGPIVCAEPSPDALSVYASAVATSVEHRSGTSASFTGSSNEAGTAFGLRTQSIQLLRDAYYRACEAYMSGAIDRETYDTLIRRLNNQAIGYLAIEQITTGVIKAAAPVIAPPNLKELYTKLDEAQKLATAAAEKKKKASEELTGIPETEKQKREEKQKEIDAAEGERKKQTEEAEKLRQQIVDASKPILVPPTANGDAPEIAAAAVNAARDIALSVVEADYSPQMCFAYFRFNKDADHTTSAPTRSDGAPALVKDLSSYCKIVLTNFADGYALRNQLMLAQADALKEYCRNASRNSTTDATCAALLLSFVPPKPILGVQGSHDIREIMQDF